MDFRYFFTRDEIGFGHVTDSPVEAVGLIVKSLPEAVKARLTPAREDRV